MAAAAVLAGEIGLRICMCGAGDVPGEIGVTRATVDETGLHGASLTLA
jgi:hypothetical protein